MSKKKYSRQTKAAREIARETNPGIVMLWDVSVDEIERWEAFTGNPGMGYAGYQRMLTEVLRDLEKHGHTVVLVPATVAEVQAALEGLGLPNSPENRAAALVVAAENRKKNEK